MTTRTKRTTSKTSYKSLLGSKSLNKEGNEVITMSPVLKKKWIQALRSGKYQQGKYNLCTVNEKTNEEKYCCLGVLMEILIQNEFPITTKLMPSSNHVLPEYQSKRYTYTKDEDKEVEGFLPPNLAKELGLGESFNSNSTQSKLAAFNDTKSRKRPTFKEMADRIQKMNIFNKIL